MNVLKNTRLWKSLIGLSAPELTAFHKFLSSPYFNQREDVVQLFDYFKDKIGTSKLPQAEAAWHAAYGSLDLDDQKLRLLMSYLNKLLKQFLAIERFQVNEAANKREVAAFWREGGQQELQQQALAEAERSLERSAYRNADFQLERYLLVQERYREAYRKQPEKGTNFQLLDRVFNIAFIAMKLRETCLLIAHGQVYDWGFEPSLLEPLYAYVEANNLLKEPSIGIYWYGIKMLQAPENEAYFRQFKALLLEHARKFPPREVQDLYLLAINYGVRRVNDGQQSYFYDIMDFYKDGLQKEYLLQNGQLSRFTYHNIVSVALQIGEAEWAEDFLQQWTGRLDRRYRERMESFNKAKIAYHQKQYDRAIPLLQRANYHDLLLNLGARTLLLKIYFELEEFGALDSHIEAFQSYLSRKAALGYHRKNYRTLIRYTRKILQIRPGDQKEKEQLAQKIQDEPVLTEKRWLLEQLQ